MPILRQLSSRHREWGVGLLLVLGFALAACGPGNAAPQPPEIAYGRDLCASCGMIIGEPQFAAATLLTDGKTYKFDDVGEMFIYHAQHTELSVHVWFVHDYDSRAWINGQTAFYVTHSGLQAPMGSGVAAFADRARAQAFAGQVGGQLLSFDEARENRLMLGKQGMWVRTGR